MQLFWSRRRTIVVWESAQHMEGAIEDFELQIICSRLDEVVDDGAVRWILSRRLFRRQRCIGPGVAPIAINVSRLEEEIGRQSLGTHLAQCGDVVEDPK